MTGARTQVRLPLGDPPPAASSAPLPSILTGRFAGGTALLGIAALDDAPGVAFWAVAAVAALVALIGATVVLRRGHGRTRVIGFVATLDLLVIVSLLALAGDAQDDLLVLLVGLAPLYALAFPHGTERVLAGVPLAAVATASGLALAATVVVGLDGPFLLAFAWATLVAGILADAGLRAGALIRELREDRRLGLLTVLAAEEAERRDLARRLHDDALQLLLSAWQDLEEAAGPQGDDAARRRAADALGRALEVLAAPERLPAVDSVPSEGFGRALAQAASHARQAAGLGGTDVIPPEDPGPHAGLLLGVARELLLNVVRHSGASRVDVVVRHGDDGVVALDVRDDGVGIRPGRLEEAMRQGSIGVAAARDRVARVDGALSFTQDGEAGTRATVILPRAVPDATDA